MPGSFMQKNLPIYRSVGCKLNANQGSFSYITHIHQQQGPALSNQYIKFIYMISLEKTLEELSNVSDEDLLESLRRLNPDINEEKYINAFSLYGMTKYLSNIDISNLHEKFPGAEQARFRSVIVYRGYTTLVYMRSDVLEKKLDLLDENSKILPFKKFFRSGNIKKSEGTLAQLMRNSLCHGDFSINTKKISFNDNGKIIDINLVDFFDKFCPEIYRFYLRAFEAYCSNKIMQGSTDINK